MREKVIWEFVYQDKWETEKRLGIDNDCKVIVSDAGINK